MVDLYDINDGFKILNIKRKIMLLFFFVGIVVLGIIIFITSISTSDIVMIIDVVLSNAYFFGLYTYLFYFRKLLNEKYHFLAKIQHFEHDYIVGYISSIDKNLITIKRFNVYTISINGRSIYIEEKKIPEVFYSKHQVKLEVVDNFIVGYEVVNYE